MSRTFETGATRDDEEGKLDYEGFFSPLVMLEFSRYMDEKRNMPDGSRRESDNWQKGMPIEVYMKSMWRHFMDVWMSHRSWECGQAEQKRALCALMFNVQGYLHELLSNPDYTGDVWPSVSYQEYHDDVTDWDGISVTIPEDGGDEDDLQWRAYDYGTLEDTYTQAPLPSLEEEEDAAIREELAAAHQAKQQEYHRHLYKCGDSTCACVSRDVMVKPRPTHDILSNLSHSPQSHGQDFWALNACDHKVCQDARKQALGC